MKRRTILFAAAGVAGAGAIAAIVIVPKYLFEFPPDTKPEGAYFRIAHALTQGEPRHIFDYLEDAARNAVHTIHGFRKDASALVAQHFPEPERTKLVDSYASVASAADGADAFVALAKERGWIAKLRADLSGIAEVQVEGPRATIVTARGTRYSFRVRDTGAWGLTLFTADLVTEADRAARDYDVVRRAAEDYASAGQ